MATTNGGGGPVKGKEGPRSYYVRQGQVIARQRTNRTSNPNRTEGTMTARTQMKNLIAQWRSFGGGLKDCFEKAKSGSTDYSGFMAVNRRFSHVFLTKEQAMASYAIADNVAVSQGTLLPNIQVEEREDWVMSDIYVSDNALQANTPLAAVSFGIGALYNGTVESGDEIVFVRMTQNIGNPNNRPMVESLVARLRVDNNCHLPWKQMLSSRLSDDGFQVCEGRLCCERRRNSLVAWVHLRRVSKERVLATSQNLVGFNPLLADFTSEAAWYAAITSYGPLSRRGLPRENRPRGYQFPAPASPDSYQETLQAQAPQPPEGGDVSETPPSGGEGGFTISVVASPLGGGTALGGGTCLPGTELHLSAQAAPGYRFLSWEDGCTEPQRILRAEKSDTLTAFFVRNQ